MSKATAMLALQPLTARAPRIVSPEPAAMRAPVDESASRTMREHRQERARLGPLWCWVRQGGVRARRSWRPWWLLGLVEVVTYPRPHYALPKRRIVLPAMRAIPAFGIAEVPARVLFVEA